MLQETPSKAWFTIAKFIDEEKNLKMNSLEKLIVSKYFINAYYLWNLELKREIKKYWRGQRRINDVEIDSLHTK